jgi:hypothetical protein
MFQPRDEYPTIDGKVLESWSFDGVDIRAEHVGARGGMVTVKAFTVEALSSTVEYVVDDDRAGEIADLVTISAPVNDGVWGVNLVHLKASSEAAPGARVEDLYDLLGQASRSVIRCDSQRLARRLLERLATGSSVLKGNESSLVELLSSWSESPVPTRWSIAVVQPGLRADQVNESQNVRVMLNDFVEWVAQHDANPVVYAHS